VGEYGRGARISHALELTFESLPGLRRAVSILGSARTPVGYREYELGELDGVAGLAGDTILRRDGGRGPVVALAPRDVPAAPAELPLTGAARPARLGGAQHRCMESSCETWGKACGVASEAAD
jgi:hypothetical protein